MLRNPKRRILNHKSRRQREAAPTDKGKPFLEFCHTTIGFGHPRDLNTLEVVREEWPLMTHAMWALSLALLGNIGLVAGDQVRGSHC